MKKYIWIILMLSVTGCSGNQKARLKEGKAYFQYFSYRGNDTYFREFPLKYGEFYNPILSGFFPDPSICNKGGDYYLVTSTFSFFPGIPMFHSTDLINWKQIGHVLNRPSQFINNDQPVSYGIFAPAIEYNPHNDLFYLTTTYVGGGGNFVVTALDPAGPWSDPIWLPEVVGIDPSLFFDEDGRAFIVNNGDPDYPPLYRGHKAVWMQEFDVVGNKMVGPRKVIRDAGHNIAEKPIWIEGPHIYKLHGYYYLMTAEGGTSIDHRQVIFRSKNLWGPYETYRNNPILTQRTLDKNRPFPVTNTGHADLVKDQQGNWWAIFLACRPYNSANMFNIGRETFILPVRWTSDKWPVILESGKTVPLIVEPPDEVIIKDNEPGYMKRGNFEYTEFFQADSLPLEWFFLRTITEKWYETDKKNGGIWIAARPVNLRQRKHPSFIGTRQRHHIMTVETVLHFLPGGEKSIAGLSLFQNEANHYVFGVTKQTENFVLVLQKSLPVNNEPQKTILASVTLPKKYDGRIELRVVADNDMLAFWYKTSKHDWVSLADSIDATYLSTEKAGGFIGTILAMYASSED